MLRNTRAVLRSLPRFRRSLSVPVQRRANNNVSYIQQRTLAAKAKQEEEPKMFCFQCEQTKNRTGCVQVGVCGKVPQVAKLQDLTVHAVKGLSVYADNLAKVGGQTPREIFDLCTFALFATVTNVNFDHDRFPPMIKDLLSARDQLKSQYESLCAKKGVSPENFTGAAQYELPEGQFTSIESMEKEGEALGVQTALKDYGPSVNGVREMMVYGIKGTVAYYTHANRMGQRDDGVEQGIVQVLSFLESGDAKERHDLGANLGQALKVGEINMKVMEILDKGHRETYGSPTPTSVLTTPVLGKCILVSGHDMTDIHKILQMTEGKGINVYTHGEMLPAHSYPNLKKFKHLAGHYGGGWQLQQFEFPSFPGPVVLTSNCLVEPRKSYSDRIYTLNSVGWPGTPHLDLDDVSGFQEVIDQALELDGFTQDDVDHEPEHRITVGFGHETVLGVADKVLDAASSGALKHIFLVGGCDGSENKRNYFTKLVGQSPDDTLILTLGCAKYRFNRLRDYGMLGDSGIPRLLDMGQCNDAYGAVKVALALAEALKTDVNSLPLSLCISWFEQKAVAVLLSLLHLGVRNIRVGPVIPAFLTPEVYEVLHDKFNLLPIDLKKKRDPVKDIELMIEEQRVAALNTAK